MTSFARVRTDPDLGVVGEYVLAEAVWLAAVSAVSILEVVRVAAAQQYVTAIDAYVHLLRATGRQVPHHMDDLADTLRGRDVDW
jgi:hypothetical protein